MTSPFSKPGRDQTVPDDDPIVPDGDQAVLDDGRTAPADDIRADDIDDTVGVFRPRSGAEDDRPDQQQQEDSDARNDGHWCRPPGE